MQFIIMAQDCAKRYRYQQLILSVPTAINQRSACSVSIPGVSDDKTFIGQETYQRWIENFKIA